MSDNNKTGQWTSRWTFIMAATGSAVGLGNIWKFPYITGEYGGGAFVLVYLGCILLIGIPIMMAEVMLGRSGRENPIKTMLKASKASNCSPIWSVIGYLGVASGLAILMFYSVIAGWVMDYFVQSISGGFSGMNTESISQNFDSLTANNPRELLWHTLFTGITVYVVARGIQSGIGKMVEYLMPLLFLLLCVMLGYSLANGDFSAGFEFMFYPDFSKLTPDAVLEALGHSFFTLSLGMGAIMVYGSYMPDDASIGKTVLLVGFFDTLIALMAGMIIFPLVFANGMESDQSVGLMFKTLPIVFGQMPGGVIFGSIFFALVTIAALSSSVSLIEPGVAWLQGKGHSRTKAVSILGIIAWTGGVLCIYWGSVFDFLDNLTTRFTLPIGGLLIAIFVGWAMPKALVAENFESRNSLVYTGWIWCLRIVAPAGVLMVFASNMGMLG